MEIRVFLSIFEKTLRDCGLSEEAVRHYTHKFSTGLSEKNTNYILNLQDKSKAVGIAKQYAEKIQRIKTQSPDNTMSVPRDDFGEAQEKRERKKNGRTVTEGKDEPPTITVDVRTENTKKFDLASFVPDKVPLSEKGRVEYRKRRLKELPLNILRGFLAAAGCACVYIGMAIVFVLLVVLFAAFTISGIALFLVGFIYGIYRLFTILPEGIYESGLSLIVLGITLAICPFLYNLAAKRFPGVWKKFSAFLGKKRREKRIRLNAVRTECNEL